MKSTFCNNSVIQIWWNLGNAVSLGHSELIYTMTGDLWTACLYCKSVYDQHSKLIKTPYVRKNIRQCANWWYNVVFQVVLVSTHLAVTTLLYIVIELVLLSFQGITHTHTRSFYSSSGFCTRLPGWARTRRVKSKKVKPIWIYWSKR